MAIDEAPSNRIYRMTEIRVRNGDALFAYCDNITALANNLANAVRFRQRQMFTARGKDRSALSANETEVMDELRAVFHGGKSTSSLSYGRLVTLLVLTSNPDYFAKGLPRQTAQQTVKVCVREWKGYFEALKAYKQGPSSFPGKPELPGYRRKGGRTTAIITNQDACFKQADGRFELKLPLTKERAVIGKALPAGRLKEVRIVPDNGTYRICLVMDCGELTDAPQTAPERIASVDMGVNNLMAVTNSCSLPCLLYKGGVVKSVNRLYNKTVAKIVSKQTSVTGKKFKPTPEYLNVTVKRNDRVKDLMHKTAKHLITWCVENRIDTLVCGVNEFWKQEVRLGRTNGQNFVQIPFFMLRGMLRYLCEGCGIRYVEREESYTSQASFRDRDNIPVYRKGDDTEHTFSGRRGVAGSRGLYQDTHGVINADLNGSANILRKAFPDAFANGNDVMFDSVVIVKHPDYDRARALHKRQAGKPKSVSKAKAARLLKKKKAAA